MLSNKVRQILFYSIPSFVSKGISLILIPLYTARLSVADFGQLELLAVFASFLQYSLHFGWGSSLIRFYKKSDIDKTDLTKTLLIFRVGIQFFVLFFVWIIGLEPLSTFLVNDPKLNLAVLWVIVLYLLREDLLFYESRYRLHNQAVRFAVVNTAQALLQLAFIYYLFFLKNTGITGIFLGQVLACALVLVVLIIFDRHWLTTGKFNFHLLKRCLKYGIPLMPAALAMFLMTASDRYMLKWLLAESNALEQVGIYSLSYKFVKVLTLITAGFSTFWGPFIYSTYSQKKASLKFSFVFRCYTAILFCLALSICAVLPIVVSIVFPTYKSALVIVPLMLAGFLIYNIGDYFCIGIGIAERSDIRAKAGIVVSFCNLALNFYLIPYLGSLGAALATTVSYGIYTSILLIYSQKFYSVYYPWSTYLFPIVWLALGVPLMSIAPNKSFIYAVAGITIFSVIFWNAGGFKKDWIQIKESN